MWDAGRGEIVSCKGAADKKGGVGVYGEGEGNAFVWSCQHIAEVTTFVALLCVCVCVCVFFFLLFF